MSHREVDLWAVQVDSGEGMLGAAGCSQMIVATDGSIARLTTIPPKSFVKIKRKLSTSASRDPLNRRKDALQAAIVQQLMDENRIELRGNCRASRMLETGALSSPPSTCPCRRTPSVSAGRQVHRVSLDEAHQIGGAAAGLEFADGRRVHGLAASRSRRPGVYTGD